MNEKIKEARTQVLTLEDRRRLDISGVGEIETSDDRQVLIKTDLGRLRISGEKLNIGMLNVDSGQLTLTGHINVLEYKENKKGNGGFFASLFK